ncbi:MAG: ABC transporter ATP-binding protein [Candidatus Thorarchaeota archaeon]|jgi:ATP-binding cassette subfamily B protein
MGYIRRLIGYSLRHRGLLFGFLAAAGIGTIFNLIGPLILIHIIDNVILADNLDQLLPNVLIYVSLGGLYAFFDVIGRYGAAISSQMVIYDLRKDIYESLMEKDLAFYDENETGQLLARATTDVTTMREFLYWGIRVVFIGSAMLVGTFFVMFTVSPELTVYMFLLIPIVVVFIYVFAKRVRPVFYAARKQYGVLSSVLAENVYGHKVVRSYAQEEREAQRVEQENTGFLQLRVEASRLLSLYHPMLPALFGAVIGFLIYIGGDLINRVPAPLTLGEFVGFVSLVGMLMLPARFLSWGVGMYQRASAAGERTFYILDAAEAVINPEVPVEVTDLKGAVDFDNVFFSYKGGNFILRDVSLSVKPGQIVALLGGTGSGKTSLVNLIPRFYDVDSNGTVTYQGTTHSIGIQGKVRIGTDEFTVKEDHVEIDGEKVNVRPPGTVCVDGVDVRLYAINDLRKKVGMVHQDPFLFSASIKDNIAFGRPDASLEEVQDAAKAAMIHDFIMTLEDGYNSEIGERGVTLSGGQKQRIAIARALLADPRILILDDSTSSVDAKTEMLIQKALENLMKGRTTFIITHRLSTVRNADLIVMMERGQIIEMGSHEELVKADGLYSGIHQTLVEMEMAVSIPDSSPTEVKVSGGDTP